MNQPNNYVRAFGMRKIIYDIVGCTEKTEVIYQLFRKALRSHKKKIRYQRLAINKLKSYEIVSEA